MILHHQGKKHQIQALLDTGCSIALINEQTIQKLDIRKRQHKQPRSIESYTGEKVRGAGQFYTEPLLMQHRRHYTKESFEVSPMDPGIDIFLPFSWIEKHPPQGAWTTEDVRFNSAGCIEKCTKWETKEFSLTWDEDICMEPKAQIIGYVSAISSEEGALDKVPKEYQEYLAIMSREAADALPQHKEYDCKIELKKGETAPWGPIYYRK